jgi:hypothetical protein
MAPSANISVSRCQQALVLNPLRGAPQEKYADAPALLNGVLHQLFVILAAADTKAGNVGFALVLAFEEGFVIGAGVKRLVVVGNIGKVAALNVGQLFLTRRDFIEGHEFKAASACVEHGIVIGVKIVTAGRHTRWRAAILINGLADRTDDGIAHEIVELAAA